MSIQIALQKEDDLSSGLCNFPLERHNEGPRKEKALKFSSGSMLIILDLVFGRNIICTKR
jgi:hypothetical protein